jgi:hypothetical protein
MTAPLIKPERRQTPRTQLNTLAYVNLEPDNGAILLNASNGGLCFHSVVPVQHAETIRFWFSEHNRRIEGEGILAWTDETRKTGGLRFTNLSAEARSQIRDWIKQPATPSAADRKPAAPLSSPLEFAVSNAGRPHRGAVRGSSVPPEVLSQKTKALASLKGFSGGLVLGLLVSLLVASGFLLHAYRREVGNSLVQLGERLGARSRPQTASPIQATVSTAPMPNPIPELPTQHLPQAVTPQPLRIDAVTPVTHSLTNTARAPVIPSRPVPTALPTTVVEHNTGDVSGKLAAILEVGSPGHPSVPAEDSSEENAGSSATMYLEVGKSRDMVGADKETNKLTQLGFHAIVVHTGHLWMNSYQVLVGPYGRDDQAEAAHEALVSHGFSPRSYDRGSRSFVLPSGLTVDRTHVPSGDCVISWESYVPDAVAKFEKDGSVLATAEAKWVRREVRYGRDAVVYRKNGDGSRTLLEIRFVGMSRALVFRKPS